MKYENYAKIRDSKGMKDFAVSKASGIASSTFSDWKSGRSVPKQEKLMKIADALGVSYSELIGETITQPAAHSFDEFEMDLIKNFRDADKDTQTMIMNLLAFSKKMKQEGDK